MAAFLFSKLEIEKQGFADRDPFVFNGKMSDKLEEKKDVEPCVKKIRPLRIPKAAKKSLMDSVNVDMLASRLEDIHCRFKVLEAIAPKQAVINDSTEQSLNIRKLEFEYLQNSIKLLETRADMSDKIRHRTADLCNALLETQESQANAQQFMRVELQRQSALLQARQDTIQALQAQIRDQNELFVELCDRVHNLERNRKN